MTPRQWQYTFMAVLVVTAALLQGVLGARLPLPGPPLGLCAAAVLAIGMAGGPSAGAVAGFSAGLLLDILPPAQTTLGVTAFALMIVGALAGRIPDPRGLAPVQLAGFSAALAALAWTVSQGLLFLLGDPTAPLPWLLWWVAGVTLVSIVAVPGVSWVLRRVGTGGRRRSRRRAASVR
jgi:rod shape-determining protein MreD